MIGLQEATSRDEYCCDVTTTGEPWIAQTFSCCSRCAWLCSWRCGREQKETVASRCWYCLQVPRWAKAVKAGRTDASGPASKVIGVAVKCERLQARRWLALTSS